MDPESIPNHPSGSSSLGLSFEKESTIHKPKTRHRCPNCTYLRYTEDHDTARFCSTMVVRLTPDQKVASSTLVGTIFFVEKYFSFHGKYPYTYVVTYIHIHNARTSRLRRPTLVGTTFFVGEFFSGASPPSPSPPQGRGHCCHRADVRRSLVASRRYHNPESRYVRFPRRSSSPFLPSRRLVILPRHVRLTSPRPPPPPFDSISSQQRRRTHQRRMGNTNAFACRHMRFASAMSRSTAATHGSSRRVDPSRRSNRRMAS